MLVIGILKNAIRNPYVQAVLRGLKPCVVGIVLATGAYMIFGNCFGPVSALGLDLQAVGITALLLAVKFGYQKWSRKKLSPILLILISAAVGVAVYGI
jgi:chromate transporter